MLSKCNQFRATCPAPPSTTVPAPPQPPRASTPQPLNPSHFSSATAHKKPSLVQGFLLRLAFPPRLSQTAYPRPWHISPSTQSSGRACSSTAATAQNLPVC